MSAFINLQQRGIEQVLDFSEVVGAVVKATYFEDTLMYQYLVRDDREYLVILDTSNLDLDIDDFDLPISIAHRLGIITDLEYQEHKESVAYLQKQANLKEAKRQIRAMVNAHGARALGVELTED